MSAHYSEWPTDGVMEERVSVPNDCDPILVVDTYDDARRRYREAIAELNGDGTEESAAPEDAASTAPSQVTKPKSDAIDSAVRNRDRRRAREHIIHGNVRRLRRSN